VENFQRGHGIFFHEEAHNRLLGISRPWDRDKEEADRK
jgi:hypothetical protein